MRGLTGMMMAAATMVGTSEAYFDAAMDSMTAKQRAEARRDRRNMRRQNKAAYDARIKEKQVAEIARIEAMRAADGACEVK